MHYCLDVSFQGVAGLYVRDSLYSHDKNKQLKRVNESEVLGCMRRTQIAEENEYKNAWRVWLDWRKSLPTESMYDVNATSARVQTNYRIPSQTSTKLNGFYEQKLHTSTAIVSQHFFDWVSLEDVARDTMLTIQLCLSEWVFLYSSFSDLFYWWKTEGYWFLQTVARNTLTPVHVALFFRFLSSCGGIGNFKTADWTTTPLIKLYSECIIMVLRRVS